jgi:hypothetical protein
MGLLAILIVAIHDERFHEGHTNILKYISHASKMFLLFFHYKHNTPPLNYVVPPHLIVCYAMQ